MGNQEEQLRQWRDKQEKMGRRIPSEGEIARAFEEFKKPDCTCFRGKPKKIIGYSGKYETVIPITYNPDCMLHGQIGIS